MGRHTDRGRFVTIGPSGRRGRHALAYMTQEGGVKELTARLANDCPHPERFVVDATALEGLSTECQLCGRLWVRRYATKAELEEVIRDTLRAGGIAPERVYMRRLMAELGVIGGGGYGWTVSDPGVNPVDVARRHMRPAPPFRPSICQHEDDDHSHVTDMPSPEADALDRIAEVVSGQERRVDTIKREVAQSPSDHFTTVPSFTLREVVRTLDTLRAILRETGRLP